MPSTQAELTFAPRHEERELSEQEREEREHLRILRAIEDAADEVGRKNIAYALDLNEKLLSKQLRGAEGHQPSFRLLAYLLKEQKSGRLAAVLADYAGFLPFKRPTLQPPRLTLEIIHAKAMAGDYGKAAREEIQKLVESTDFGGTDR